MVEKKDEQAEVLKQIYEKPREDGFRKGISKKDIVKSLTADDWISLDKMKQAEERMSNKLSYALFVKADQMRAQKEDIIMNVDTNIANIYLLQEAIDKNNVDMQTGKTEQQTDKQQKLTLNELNADNMKYDVQARKFIQLIINDLSRLYTFVGRMGLDKKPFFSEEDYNAKVEDTIRKLSKTQYNIK